MKYKKYNLQWMYKLSIYIQKLNDVLSDLESYFPDHPDCS